VQEDQFELHCDIEERHWWFVARRQILHSLVRELVPSQRRRQGQATIIDVGCGTGANVASLAAEYHCVGIDTSAEAIRLAARRFGNVDFRAGFAPDDLGDCMLEAELIMLNDVLEHVADDFHLLSRILAATRPGTHVLITVPANLALWSPHDESFGHYRRYDIQRFRRLWADLPVETMLCSYFNARLYPVVRMIRAWNRLRGRTDGMAGTDFKMPGRLANRILTRVFAGERTRLRRLLMGKGQRGYATGVSLIAVVRRGEKSIPLVRKPDDVPADHYDPLAQRYSLAAPAAS
jgi:SAM-dependent methyltransferase